MFVKFFEFRVIKLSSWLICRTNRDEVEIWFMWKDPIKLTPCNINDGDDGERAILYNTHLIWMSRQRILEFCYFFYLSLSNFFSYTIWESIPVTVNNRKYLWYSYSPKMTLECMRFFFGAKKMKIIFTHPIACSNFTTKIIIYIVPL